MNETRLLEMVDKKIESYRESSVIRFDNLDEKIHEEFLFVRAGFNHIEREFKRIDEHFNILEGRFDTLEQKIDILISKS